MTQPTAVIADDAEPPPATPPPHGDPSISTPLRGSGPKSTPSETNEITVKFDFVLTSTNTAAAVPLAHQLVLSALADLDATTTIWNNHGRKLPEIDSTKWNTNPSIHRNHFITHSPTAGKPTNRTQRAIIIHRLHTDLSLSAIRNHPPIMKLLKQNNCYLRMHPWPENTWDTVQIGFLLKVNPSHYSEEAAATMIRTKFSALKLPMKEKVPNFRLKYSTPMVNIDKNKRITTKAYAIEVTRDDSRRAAKLLSDALGPTQQLVLTRMKYSHPLSFANALKLQTQHLSTTYVIPLLNVGQDAMFYLKDHLLAQTSIIDVVATRNVDTTGRFNILVPKDSLTSTRSWLTDNLNDLWDLVPTDQRPHAEAFYGPPGISTLTYFSDDEDSGTSSLSMSAASFASLSDILDEVPDNFKTPVAHVSYAEAVTGVDKESQVTMESPSELTKQTEPNPELLKLQQELESLRLENDQLRKDSQQKSEEFKQTLQNLTTKENQRTLEQREMMKMIRALQLRIPETQQHEPTSKRSTNDDNDDQQPSSKRIDNTTTPIKRNLDLEFCTQEAMETEATDQTEATDFLMDG